MNERGQHFGRGGDQVGTPDLALTDELPEREEREHRDRADHQPAREPHVTGAKGGASSLACQLSDVRTCSSSRSQMRWRYATKSGWLRSVSGRGRGRSTGIVSITRPGDALMTITRSAKN